MKERIRSNGVSLVGVLVIVLAFACGAMGSRAFGQCVTECAELLLYNYQNTQHWESFPEACWTYTTINGMGTSGCTSWTTHSIYYTNCVAWCMAAGLYGEDFYPTYGCVHTYYQSMYQYDYCL